MTENVVKKTVKNWMSVGFVMIETRWNGFGKVYTDAEEAASKVGNGVWHFVLYRPDKTGAGENRHWMVGLADYNEIYDAWDWTRARGDGEGKRTRSVVKEILANYDAILAGTYVRETKPVKAKKSNKMRLGDFFKENGITKEMWESYDVEVSFFQKISARMYERLFKYSNYISFFGAYGLNDFGHIRVDDDYCGEKQPKYKWEDGKLKCKSEIWYINYQDAESYGPDNYEWEDVCELRFDRIAITKDGGSIHCYDTRMTENDRYLREEVLPYFIHYDDAA